MWEALLAGAIPIVPRGMAHLRYLRLLRDETPDTGCGTKLFERAAFLDLPYFDHMHRYLPALALRQGARVVSEPVNHRPRTRGVSNYGTLDRLLVSLSDMLGVMWLQRRWKRPVTRSTTPASWSSKDSRTRLKCAP